MEVIAKSVDSIHIRYDCLYCGKEHWNGSCGELTNRVEHRSLYGHCMKEGHPRDVIINITDETKKINKSNNKYGKKKANKKKEKKKTSLRA
eukprot:SAG31_NODE_14503_length_803_cov_0.890625_2_plen_91_part_00